MCTKPDSVLSACPKLCGPGEDNQAGIAVQTQGHNVLLEPRITNSQSFWPTVREVHGPLLRDSHGFNFEGAVITAAVRSVARIRRDARHTAC